ncbi:hypothetical protein B9Z45_15595 [Limnohabitans sp. 2KL-17]|uniref:aspartyl/asparaginyl beta-hydroxylase domain-containing protein n=1 Tax=Limnohabitans sp. 2KL-17 TaxID=1100704 RepID=UPI000D3ACB2B|nr:aspartyl/asparaginyl beta-hydroxylase domain-containing protein [Limnohabitans sp. 2KL-17]PUE49840.1 hypothetical protein B9Z45_15595 [Limnohabitans sp. 2KL-17]
MSSSHGSNSSSSTHSGSDCLTGNAREAIVYSTNIGSGEKATGSVSGSTSCATVHEIAKVTWAERLFFLLFTAVERRNRRYSLVGDHEFFNLSEFPWVEEVAKATADIQKELDTVLARREQLPNFQDISPDQRMLTTDSGWKTFFFYGYGVRAPMNCSLCPKTEAVLQRIPGMTTAYFSILAPGKELPPHRGPYNGVLRFHLGLIIPKPIEQCAIRVGQSVRHWSEGQPLVFDDSYNHQAWNHSNQWRVVLFVDFKRPLPTVSAAINNVMLWIIRRTPFITVATRNLRAWEKTFYVYDGALDASSCTTVRNSP